LGSGCRNGHRDCCYVGRLVCSLDEAEHLSRINDVLVRGEKQEPFNRCSNRRYAAVNVSYEYEKARILEGMGKARVPEQ
jgi:hypothetical protein